ncbi:MAG TPA: hypothetical protein VGP68_21150 [Gemmataceae bacterium]|nr:hypothetical protein [Gemmataceae bacterium]
MAKHKTAEHVEAETGEPAAAANPAERQPGDEPAEQTKQPFQVVRGWTSRLQGPVKYHKFTDANLKIIAFKFDLDPKEKLPEEVLSVMREHKADKDGNATGLQFKDDRKHGKVWLIPNDVEGRMLADKIDFRLSELAQKMEEGQGKAPF